MIAGGLVAAVLGLSPPAALPPQQPATTAPSQTLHWAIKLGRRVEQVNQSFGVIDRVVLVPDGATYLDELSKWAPAGRWPVLFEDDHLAAMFIRRFGPHQVVRRESIGALAPGPDARRRRLEEVVVRAWGRLRAVHTLREAFEGLGYRPPGVVISSVDDPAWTAAVALAAGRGQPLLWLGGDFGRPNGLLPRQAAERLTGEIDALVAATGYAWEALGDDLDTITLCRAVAGRSSHKAAGADPVATSDLIGRRPDGGRYAFTGWIFGGEARCAYVAMCSLFLPRQRVWLYNTYPLAGGWGAFGVDEAATALTEKGYDTRSFSRDRATGPAWIRMLPGGFSTDVLAMNTKGNPDFFDLFSGRAYPPDVPLLNEPLALHLVHSWSMSSPQRLDTVGGQWMARGAYAWVGSVHEPHLGAFVRPALLAERWINFVPFLVGARQWQGSFSGTWKVNTYGDPLMLCRPPAAGAKLRTRSPAEYGLDLTEHAKTLMRDSEADESGAVLAEAIGTLSLLGRDDIARRLWQRAEQRGLASDAARPALGALFRGGDEEAFMRAWHELPALDPAAKDMLWHLHLPRLGLRTTKDTLVELHEAVREPMPHVDLRRLAPHLTRAFGETYTHRALERAIQSTTNKRARAELEKMLKNQ